MSHVDGQSSDQQLDLPRAPLVPRASFARLIRLCMKELRETLRDRRTIVTLVLMPLLVYPLLSVAFQKFALTSASSLSQTDLLIGVESEEASAWVSRFMGAGQHLLDQGISGPRGGSSATIVGNPNIELLPVTNLGKSVASGAVDVAVVVLNEGPPANEPLRCELLYRKDSPLSQLAVDHIQQRLDAVNQAFIDKTRIKLPADVRFRAVRSTTPSFSLTTLIPLILILMTITGAVYPAIDLTAGERERGTLETLMAAPVPRLRLLFAKYIAVLTVALFTGTANLASMTVTLVATGLGEEVFGRGGLTADLVAQVFALLILFAAFFSAILLAITSFARSFKEAQSYLIPVMLLALAPGMLSLMPELEFTGVLAVTPLVNIVLLARDIFEGKAESSLAIVAVLSTSLYAVAAIALAARVFGADAILYGSQATWSDLVTRPERPRDAATVPAAMFCLAILFPAYFLAASTLHSFPDEDLIRELNGAASSLPAISLSTRLIASAVITALVFVGVPLIAAIVQRVRLAGAFQLRPSGPLAFVAAVIFGLTLWPFAYEALMYASSSRLEGVLKHEQVRTLINKLPDLSPAILLPCLAITPAVCEELFFRGYLLGTLRSRVKPWQAIVATAVTFGVFHVLATAFSNARLIPSTLMGLVLGWVCYRTRSVWPGIVLHAFHNGFLLMIAHHRDNLVAFGIGIQEEKHLPTHWLAFAAGGVVLAAALLVFGTRRPVESAVAVKPSEG